MSRAKLTAKFAALSASAAAIAVGIGYGAANVSTPTPNWVKHNPSAGLSARYDGDYVNQDQLGVHWLKELNAYIRAHAMHRTSTGKLVFDKPAQIEDAVVAHANALARTGQTLDMPWSEVLYDVKHPVNSPLVAGQYYQDYEQRGTLTIESASTPSLVTAYAGTWDHHGVQMDSYANGKVVFKPEYLPHGGTSALWAFELAVSSLAGLIWLFAAGSFAGTGMLEIDESLNRRKTRKLALATWREHVTSDAFGPAKPQVGFQIYLPERRERIEGDDVIVTFSAPEYRFSGEVFQPQRGSFAAVEAPTEHRMSEGFTTVAEAWIEFCSEVALLNAARYSERLAKEVNPRSLTPGSATVSRGETLTLAQRKADARMLPSAKEIVAQLGIERSAV